MAKHKYIETPERMLELFEEYKEHVKNNPRQREVFGGKDFEKRYENMERPLTMEGFENYVAKRGIIQSLDQYFCNQDGLYDDYMGICSRVRREIRQDQIEGGMVGQYNPSITQRLNGLTDKKEVDVKTEQPLFGPKE